MSEPVLALRDIRCAFGGLGVLNALDLDLLPYSIVGLIGGNGAGKTTLLNAINGFLLPQSGSIRLCGRDIASMAAYERSALGIGRIFQESRVWPEWSVAEHLSMVAANAQASRLQELRQIAPGPDVATAGAGTLSLFQRRKLELALAAILGSEVLLVDEIAAGLSRSEAEVLYAEVIRLVQGGLCRSAIMVEHKIDLLVSYTTELCLLENGHVSERAFCSDHEKVSSLLARMLGQRLG